MRLTECQRDNYGEEQPVVWDEKHIWEDPEGYAQYLELSWREDERLNYEMGLRYPEEAA